LAGVTACASSAKRKAAMGVRLREAASGRIGKGQAGEIVGLDELVVQIGRIGDFPKEMAKELRKGNRKIGSAASNKLKRKLRPLQLKDDFKVYEGTQGMTRAKRGEGKVRMEIPKGTLARSIGVKNSRGSKINVFVGPRAGGTLKNDGWFAGIVESGHVGGMNKTVGSRNYNQIVPFFKRYRPVMERMFLAHMRATFNKYKL
jgi:hypothetical protein